MRKESIDREANRGKRGAREKGLRERREKRDKKITIR